MSFTCPQCRSTSQNPRDEAEGYCGSCHSFTGADPRTAALPALSLAQLEALLGAVAARQAQLFRSNDISPDLLYLERTISEAILSVAAPEEGGALRLIQELREALARMRVRDLRGVHPAEAVFDLSLEMMRLYVVNFVGVATDQRDRLDAWLRVLAAQNEGADNIDVMYNGLSGGLPHRANEPVSSPGLPSESIEP